jgi:hypothetical protein
MPAKKKRNPFGQSPWMRVQQETTQDPHLRRGLISKLSRTFEGTVVTFFTSPYDDRALIQDDDVELLESVLAAEHPTGKIILIINSAGGYALAAERFVNVCRAYSDDDFEVVVPHMAKSAATMICFGAKKIWMSNTSELGPVDPQVPYTDDFGKRHWLSAQEYIRSYQTLMRTAASGQTKRIEPYIQQLARYDSRYVEGLISATKLANDISVKLLKASMMSTKTEERIKRSIKMFLSQEVTQSHGRMIGPTAATRCGLNIGLIDIHSDLWKTVWELYVRGVIGQLRICAQS